MSKHHKEHAKKHKREHIKQAVVLFLAALLWFVPSPEGLTPQAWHLFVIFIAAIASVIIEATSIFVASIIALSASILLGVLSPQQAYSGFSKGFILLIVVAFLIARAVIKAGLGKRIAFLIKKVRQKLAWAFLLSYRCGYDHLSRLPKQYCTKRRAFSHRQCTGA